MSTLGKKVENLRKIKKISQAELAQKIGLTVTGYQDNIYRDDFKVSILMKISDALGVSIQTFFTDIEIGINTDMRKQIEVQQKEIDKLKTDLLICRQDMIRYLEEKYIK